ncbi:type IX secretion system anionic LPS delivery protein PorZ [Wenyingzhuangia sp. IMCC45574]
MRKHIYIIFTFYFSFIYAQKDFSENWEDLYSYNNIKDFEIVDNSLVAITENAMFTYNLTTEIVQKFSSVNGLFGGETSAVGYDAATNTTLIGYGNGLIELVSSDNKVLSLAGIKENLILVDKRVNGFYNENGYSYVFGDFGIVELSIPNVELGNSFKLESNNIFSKALDMLVVNNVIYVGTESGLYSFDLNSNLEPANFNNWTLIGITTVSKLIEYSGQVLFVLDKSIYEVTNPSLPVISVSDKIEELSAKEGGLVVTTASKVYVYENNILIDELDLSESLSHNFTSQKAIIKDGKFYLSTSAYGILSTELSDKLNYSEIHPNGPSGNDTFSITAKNGDVWISYGGYSRIYNFLGKSRGLSGRFQNQWYNIPYSEIGARDITKVEVNPNDPQKIYAASYFSGVVLLDFVEKSNSWEKVGVWNPDTTSNGIQDLTVFDAVIAHISIDNNDKLWVNSLFSKDYEYLSRYNFDSETWETRVNFSDYFFAPPFNDIRIIDTFFAKDGNVFCGSSGSGVVIFKDSHDENLEESHPNNNIEVINQENSNLPSLNVRAIVVDEDKKVWVGTRGGLVLFRDYESLYNVSNYEFETVIIEENGFAREFLAETQVNDIIVDNSGNKWFGTQGAGVFYTSPDAQTTFEIFNQGNSPLPSNNIVDLELDKETGRIYIVTDKGVVSFNPNSDSSSLFGDKITEIVAYPNPAIANKVGHSTIKIVAKGGGGLPEDTNVKIMDVSGKLVFEKNVKVTDANGGVVVWNKKNLSGNLVVSGVYIVLVSSPDGQENATTKIAIVN